jgi:hypothetical protein
MPSKKKKKPAIAELGLGIADFFRFRVIFSIFKGMYRHQINPQFEIPIPKSAITSIIL